MKLERKTDMKKIKKEELTACVIDFIAGVRDGEE